MDMLTISQYQNLLEHITNCLITKKDKQILKALDWAQEFLRFDSAIVLQMRAHKKQITVDNFINHSYKSEWIRSYQHEMFINKDPVVKFSLTHPNPFNWAEAFQQIADYPKTFLEAANDYGLTSGMTYSIKHSDSLKSSYTLLSFSKVDKKKENTAAYLLQSLLPAFKEVLANNSDSTIPLGAPNLTPKEVEALKWAKEGKSSWDISKIMCISERTVKFHLHNSYTKLDVMNRAQAVAKALHLNLI